MEKMKELYAQYNCDLKDADVKSAVEAILAKDFAKNNTVEVYKKCLNSIDLTSLLGTDTEEKIAEMMRKVNDFPKNFPNLPNVAAVCVYPSLVPVTREVLNKNNGVNIAAVAACFPASQSFIEVKVAETALTVKAGADEIDVVISLGKFMSGAHSEVYDELSELKAACKNAHLKVILESGSLRSAVEIKQASLLAMAAGADFIKTSRENRPAATLEAAYVMCGAIKEYSKNRH